MGMEKSIDIGAKKFSGRASLRSSITSMTKALIGMSTRSSKKGPSCASIGSLSLMVSEPPIDRTSTPNEPIGCSVTSVSRSP